MAIASWLRKLTTRALSSKKSKKQTKARRPLHRRLPLRMELLEDRAVPAVFTVTTAADDPPPFVVGQPMSLRQAIVLANANAGADDIIFNIPGAGPHILQIDSAQGPLPAITGTLTIDGTTQSGYSSGTPAIIIDGDDGVNPQIAGNGILFTPGATEDLTVLGLQVQQFGSNGIAVTGGGTGNTVLLQDVISLFNNSDGINLFNVGDVTFSSSQAGIFGVSGIGNLGAGFTINRASSLSITDGNFSDNNDGGVRTVSITGNVTLTRVQAMDNDSDSDAIGHGFEAANGLSPAIGGNLIVSGGNYSSTAGSGDENIIGFFVQQVVGSVTFQNASGPSQEVRAEGNWTHGVFIQDGGTSATFNQGEYNNNGQSGAGDGVRAFSFSGPGTVTFTDVDAENNAGHGLNVDAVTTLTITNGLFDNNGLNGLDLDAITTVNLNNVGPQLNTGHGLKIANSTTVNITGGSYRNNGDDGMNFSIIAGVITITNVQADLNGESGIDAFNLANALNITGGTFDDNTLDGITVRTAAAISTTNVTVTGNDAAGLNIDLATSFTDVDGVYSLNDDHGIRLRDISGAVSLTRTTANDNDADFDDVGDGLNATDGPDGGLNAIGSLTVSGGSFSIVGAPQSFGIFVSRVAGAVVFQNSGALQVIVDNNDEDGVRIMGGTSASFTNGQYTGNDGFNDPPNVSDGDGIHLENFTGTISFDSVTATGNADDGIDVANVSGTVTFTNVTATGNNDDGIEVSSGTSLVVTGGTFSNNLDDGIQAQTLSGSVTISGIAANNNEDDGLDLLSIAGPTTITGSTFNQNFDNGFEGDLLAAVNVTSSSFNDNDADNDDNGDGVNLENVGNVTFDTVVASGNDPGVFISGALSFSDTDGIYQANDNHGIHLIDIAGVVTLTRTRAEDNDADLDGVGDGVFAEDGADAGTLAIGGLVVNVGFFRDTTGVPGLTQQIRGIAIEDALGGNVNITDATADQNVAQGLFIQNGNGFDVTITNGLYSNSQTSGGIEITDADDITISGATASGNVANGIFIGRAALQVGDISLISVTASDNGFAGVFATDAHIFSDNAGNYQNNGEGGLVVDDVTTHVTLTNTLSQNNDQDDDGFGSGFLSRSIFNVLAIGGNFTVSGGFFRDTGLAGDHQEFGILIESVGGTVSVTNATVTGNEETGIQLSGTGTNTVTFSGGTFSNNGTEAGGPDASDGDGINLIAVRAVTMSSVNATGNFDDGLDIDGTLLSFSDTLGNYTNNGDDGVVIDDITTFATFDRTTANDNDERDVGGRGVGIDLVGTTLTINGGSFSDLDNTLHRQINGFRVGDVDGAIVINLGGGFGTVMSGNALDGLIVPDGGTTTTITGATFNNNGLNGVFISFPAAGGAFTTNSVTATGNLGVGFQVVGTIASFSDTLGTYSDNGFDGLLLDTITGNVTLDRTTANDNNENSVGASGFRVGAVITGNLLVQGGSFSDLDSTTAVQENGVLIADVDGTTTFALGGGFGTSATGNANDGVLILDGGTTGSFTSGTYAFNGDDGIDLTNFSGTITMFGVTADSNDDNGLEVDVSQDLDIDNSSFSDNLGNGINADSMDDLFLTDVTAVFNGNNGLQATNLDDVFMTPGFGPSFFDDNGDHGIFLFNVGDVTIVDVSANDNGQDGLEVTNGGLVNISRSTFNDNGDNGILLDNVGDTDMDGVQANGNGLNGLEMISSFFADITITGVVAQSNFDGNQDDGIHLDDVFNVTLDNVTARGNITGDGLDVFFVEAVDLANSVFDSNGQIGVRLNDTGTIFIDNISASLNGDDGMNIFDGDFGITVSNSIFNDNVSDGVDILDSNSAIVFTSVTALRNDPGLNMADIGSFSDTLGNYSDNDDGGIVIFNVLAGDVTLDRTTANNNDADNDDNGDGVRITGTFAGNLIVSGATFRDTDGAGATANQEHGLFMDVSDTSVDVTFNNAGAIENTVTGNEEGGVSITIALGAGTSNATFIDGNYDSNRSDGIDLEGFDGTISLDGTSASGNNGADANGIELFGAGTTVVNVNNVTASNNTGVSSDGFEAIQGTFDSITITNSTFNGNGDNGIDIDDATVVLIDPTSASNNAADGIVLADVLVAILSEVTANNNGQDGFDATNVSVLIVNDFTGTGNGSGFGGSIHGVVDGTDFFFDTTTVPAGNTTADIVTFFPTGPGGERLQHQRGATPMQPITWDANVVDVLDVDFFGGDDEAVINPGTYTLNTLDLDGGSHIVGDRITYNGTTGNDTIDIDCLVVSVNGNVQPGGVGTVNIVNFELLGVNALDGNDTITITDICVDTTINAGLGNDSVDGTGATRSNAAATLTINGDAGNDTLVGTPQNDTINGGDGNDSIVGLAGNDTMTGGIGNDTLVNGAGNDSMVGDAGNDNFVFPSGLLGDDTVVEVGGCVDRDALDFTTFAAAVAIDLNLTTAQVITANLTLTLSSGTGIENFFGSSGSDSVIGNDCDNLMTDLIGVATGNDTFVGGNGNDTLVGFDGDDSLVGGAGNDSLVGGSDDDTLVGGTGNDTMDGGTGSDLYIFAGTTLGADSIVEPGGCVDIDTLDYSSFATNLTVNLGITIQQTVSLGNSSITLSTNDGIENFFAGTGNDSIVGNACDNFLDGSSGNDTILGGNVLGVSGNDLILGGDGNDSVNGDGGNDIILGGNGNDTLLGGANDDLIFGEAGNDSIIGGTGVLDIMNGGTGDDTFLWNSGDGSDIIDGDADRDFSIVNGSSVGNDSFTISPNGIRVDFDLNAAGSVSLDVGTVEVFDVNTLGGNDTVALNTELPAPVDTIDVDGGSGNDLFRIDFTASNVLPTTVIYNGGSGLLGEIDILRLEGGGVAFATETYNATGPTAGNIDLDGQPITYSNTERLDQTKAATDLVFNVDDVPVIFDDVHIEDGPSVNSFSTTRIRSANGAFAELNFANKTNATVNTLSGDDTVTINNPNPDNDLVSLTVNGSDGVDVFNVTPSAQVTYNINGGAPHNVCPGDVLNINFAGTTGAQLTIPNPLAPYDGFWSFTNRQNVNFTSIEDFPGIQIVVVGTDFGTTPRVRVFDAMTQTQLALISPFGSLSNFSGGARVAAGDVNGDCYPDIIVSAGPGSQPRVEIYDGLQARLFGAQVLIKSFNAFESSLRTGVFVATGDFNQDGLGEVVASTGGPASSRVRVYNGEWIVNNVGPAYRQLVAFSQSSFRGGVTVAVGDYNGDGQVDLITGAGPTAPPFVKVFNGTDILNSAVNPQVLDLFLAFEANFRRGIYVAAVDLNYDGTAEILTARNAAGLTQLQPFDLQITPILNVPPEVRIYQFDGTNHGGAPGALFGVVKPFAAKYKSGVRVGGWSDGAPGFGLASTGPGVSGGGLVDQFDQTLVDNLFAAFPATGSGYFVGGSKRRDGLLP